MEIDNKFELGQFVALRTGENNFAAVVIGIIVSELGVSYQVACGLEISTHYSSEIVAITEAD